MHKAGLTADRQDHREVAQRASARRAGGLMFLFFSLPFFVVRAAFEHSSDKFLFKDRGRS